MSSSKIARRKKSAESEIQRVALSRDPNNFDAFLAFLQDNWNVRSWPVTTDTALEINVGFWGTADIARSGH
jgi:hypothetical protein